MTLDQFFEQLEQTPRDWFIWPHGNGRAIRRTPPDDDCQQCPISSLAGKPVHLWDWVAVELSIPEAVSVRIMRAADGDRKCSDVLRARLLKACGLA